MISLTKKLNYDIISAPCGIPQELDGAVIYKISIDTEHWQIPQFRLFTNNTDLTSYLHQHGFYLPNNLLTSKVICYIGQIAANEVLVRSDLQASISTTQPMSDALYNDLLKESRNKTKIVEQIQEKIRRIVCEELQIAYDDLYQHAQFKLKLTLLLQEYIYQLRSKQGSSYNQLIYNLNQTINLIDDYKFSENHPAPIQGSNKLKTIYSINPHLFGSIKNLEDVIKFYLTINKYGQKLGIISIQQEEFQKIAEQRKKYNSRFTVNNVLNYLRHHYLRSLCFAILIILECIFLPSATPLLASYKLLTFFGLHKIFILLPFCISYTFYLVNAVAELPQVLIDNYKRFTSWLLGSNNHNPDQTPDDEQLKSFLILVRSSINHAYYSPSIIRPKKFLSSLPLISNITQIIIEEYKNYCNWYFSYIQRNPISLLIYLSIRITSFFLSAITPLGRIIYCTYIDIERSLDLQAIKTNQRQSKRQAEPDKDATDDQHHVYQSHKKSRLNSNTKSLFNNCYLLLYELMILFTIKFPLGLAFMASKIVLSCIYLALFLIFNLIIETFKLLTITTAHRFLLTIEKEITSFYYNIYFAFNYQYDYLKMLIDDSFFPSVKPVLQDKYSPKLFNPYHQSAETLCVQQSTSSPITLVSEPLVDSEKIKRATL